jgi:translation initiation factor IF-3
MFKLASKLTFRLGRSFQIFQSNLFKYSQLKSTFAKKVKKDKADDEVLQEYASKGMDFDDEKVKFKNESESPEAQSKPENKQKITTKILSEIIGSKHYPTNEEISISDGVVVSVYDENDKFLTNMSLKEAKELASSNNKDLVLRNSKVTPAVVKVMRYKAELIKRLLQKVGKNIGRELGGNKQNIKKKIFPLSLKMEKKDFESKLDKLRQLLSENHYVKVLITCNLKNAEETTKSIARLKSMSDELNEISRINAGPIKQTKKKEKVEYVDPNLMSSVEEHIKHDQIIKEAKEISSQVYLESEKELEYYEYIYVELESLIVDTSGVDYEKLLEGSNLENIIRGITHTNSTNTQEQFEKSIQEANVVDTAMLPVSKQIELMEKQAVSEKDLRKRLTAIKTVQKLRSDLEHTRMGMTARMIKTNLRGVLKCEGAKLGILKKE